MNTVVLLGDNIGHSLSPRLHNYLFERHDISLRYELMPLRASEVLSAVERMKRGDYRGANVTSPYKERVLPAVDGMSESAATIGAVNTILFEYGDAIGYNTDLAGIAYALDPHLPEVPFSAAVIGTGGAARAALCYLLDHDGLDSVTIYSRDRERAARLADGWDGRVVGESLEKFAPVDMVVHATPIGLPGNPGQVIDESKLVGSEILFEMIYSPVRTPLVESAERVGMRIVSGVDMFVGQALEAFRIWTGVEVRPDEIPPDLFAEVG
jgi:shikimate dehydrogenase